MSKHVGGKPCVDEQCVHREQYPEHLHYNHNPYRHHVRVNKMMQRPPNDTLQEYVVMNLPWGSQN